MLMIVKIPRDLAVEIEKLGYNVEDFVLLALQEKINKHIRRRGNKKGLGKAD